jgi:hypothetical protein
MVLAIVTREDKFNGCIPGADKISLLGTFLTHVRRTETFASTGTHIEIDVGVGLLHGIIMYHSLDDCD